MKTTKQGIITALALLLASAAHTFAIEGLTLSVQCSNVVLSWPSIPGQNYVVQYRPTLDPSTPWTTLTSSLSADWTTNITFFVHSNVIQNPNCNGSDDSLASPAMDSSAMAAGTVDDSIPASPPVPMAMPANGSAAAVPLAIFPPDFNLSNFIIFDPSTSEWVSGAGYATPIPPATVTQTAAPQPMIPQPPGGGGGGAGPTDPPQEGFYMVVQDGVKIADSAMALLTNGILSNSVAIAFEAANAANDGTGTNLLGNIDCAVLLVDGVKFPGDGVLGPLSETYPWRFNMDTAYLENGGHTLQLAVTWLNPDNSAGNNVNITRYSDPVTIAVSNQIYYPNWEPEVGEAGISAYFAETTATNVNWTITFYDVNSNFVQTLNGYTADGTIEAYWDMEDANGDLRTNANLDPEFSSIITVYDAPMSKPTPKKVHHLGNWPDHGVWTIAYQDFLKYEYHYCLDISI